jgi:hypothetical protein
VSWDMLVQGTAQGDIDHLLAAADAKHGKAAIEGGPQRLHLRLVQLWVRGADQRTPLLTVERRLQIPAARKQEPAHALQDLVQPVSQTRSRRHEQWPGAHRSNRPDVGLVVGGRPLGAVRDADSGPGGGRSRPRPPCFQEPTAPAGTGRPPCSPRSSSIAASSSGDPCTLGPLNQLRAETSHQTPVPITTTATATME